MKLREILQICIQNNLPFFSYRMPHSHDIKTGIQLTPLLTPFSGFEAIPNGFVISPFDSQSSTNELIIQANISFSDDSISDKNLDLIQSTAFKVTSSEINLIETTKEEYSIQANKLIDKLQREELEKVVLSRVVTHNSIKQQEAPAIYEKLTKTYPHAFVSIFYIPEQAIWLGASPETLLKRKDNNLQTMSLAGTKAKDPIRNWTDKERTEQQIVSDFVEQILSQFSFDEIMKEGPTDQVAGNVCHLMTKYDCSGSISNSDLYKLIKMLHPTPAVGGIPKEKSIELIRETEIHQREYYAGFIGPVTNSECQLFVNLRCMKLTSQGVSFFVGGGLTAQSDADAEWNETCLKLETLSNIIHN